VGRNCRFLQGPQTEGRALQTLVTSIRDKVPTLVRITNVRKDGTSFVNELSLHPIWDSTGKYRFNVGLLCDTAAPAPAGVPLMTLREKLPTQFDVAQQPPAPAPFVPADYMAQWKEFQPATSKLMRMLWSTDADGALRKLITMPAVLCKPAIASLGSFFATKQKEDEQRFLSMLNAMQSGQWDVLAGRVDQPST